MRRSPMDFTRGGRPLAMTRPGAPLQFMRLGHQCPFGPWFRQECSRLAQSLGTSLEDVDLTGVPQLAAAAGAFSSAQLVAPQMPPLAAPRPEAALMETLRRPLPVRFSPPRLPPRASHPDGVCAYGPGDGLAWREAIAATVRLCLGQSPAAAYEDLAVSAKAQWLEGLALEGGGPLLFLGGDPRCPAAFAELIPAGAAHVPLPHCGPRDLFLTCIAGRDGGRDSRPGLLAAALAWLANHYAGCRPSPAVWAVSGRHAAYPNGPAWLFAGAGFEEAGDLGRILLDWEWDQVLLVRWPGVSARA